MADDNVKFEKTAFPSSVPPETKIRTSVSTEVGHTDAEIQHVILDGGDGTAPTLGLSADAATATNQAALLTELQLKADLTETQPISAATLPLPSGAATAANQVLQVTKYITKVEEATATITYVGYAAPGTATAGALWRIMRIDTSALAADVLYAGGDMNFDNVWDDRAGLSYS